ncbi:1-acyl-sn-glycerol-3-phosphate acyltransferase [Thermosulfurimonas sp. F29]|uniref:lysophospholipid acyltransferase family protein n=1 Tax=Thermosulfurimonas sp. F29 TaxID=2867247 RepID=UPI001C834DAD|nr:lysophospholipid acyltransferase family protein [Thermosulfurimonas sp. F29]MBX6423973.1 1-acyl-sn-glycerol-3-phosphate acyltransferase [Thermosulfurimonas sp. F29]
MEIFLRNLILALFLLTSVPAFGTVAILIALVEKRKVLAHRVAWLWCRIVLRISGVRIEVEGLERLDPEKRYVFFANHRSQMDIPVLEEVLRPFEIRFLAKRNLFRIPFFGWGLSALGYIPVEREDPREGLRSLIACAERVRAGYSVVVFPEGTRSADGRLLPFKTAGFLIPIRAGVPAVPVAILGTEKILPKGKLIVRPGRVRVIIGEPIPTQGLSSRDKEKLARKVRNFVEGFIPPAGP